MPIEFDVDLKPEDMFRFNMYQAYTGFNGLSSIVFSIVMFGVAIYTYGETTQSYTMMCLLLGVVLLIYMPVTLWLRVKQSLKASPVLGNTLHYHIDEAGFTVTQGEASGVLAWEQIYKIVATKHIVLVYSNRVNAYVIPRIQLGEHYAALAELAAAKLPKYRVKMKAAGSGENT